MDRFVVGFIRASLVWLGLGVILGIAMSIWPAGALAYRAAHFHANLLGFVSMMIFGVAYHVIPRFTGSPLHSRRLPVAHLWLANLGLGGMVGGWVVRVWGVPLGGTAVAAGALLSATGAGFFIYNLWRTLDRVPAAAASGGVPLTRLPTAAPAGR
jgi:heme/copper-type cytochrome/quinol oxidase subunit 1